jgi:hypothetical protein
MKKIIVCVLLCISAFAFSENHVKEKESFSFNESTLSVSHSSNDLIVKMNHLSLLFTSSKRNDFLKYIDVCISILDNLEKNDLYDGKVYPITTFVSSNNINIRTSVVLKQKNTNGYILLYVNHFSSYTIVEVSKQNLVDLKQSFSNFLTFVTTIDSKTQNVLEIILKEKSKL